MRSVYPIRIFESEAGTEIMSGGSGKGNSGHATRISHG